LKSFPHFERNEDPPDIGTIVPRSMIERAGGEKAFATIKLSDELKVHRRRDFGRVRTPVNGKRGHKTSKFHSLKNDKAVVMNESFVGERWRNAYFEVAPCVLRHWDQLFIAEIHDDAGACWAVPDSFLEGTDGSYAFVEGKTGLMLVTRADGHKELVRGLPDETRMKLLRLQSAFARAGYKYVVFDQAWSSHPIRIANISMVLGAFRSLAFGTAEKVAVSRLLDRNELTVGDCASVFEEKNCPEEWVCAAMAHGVIEIDLDRPIDRLSRVSRPGLPFWNAA
jgi:hypothetical protein